MSQEQDMLLVDRLKRGDLSAFDDLYRKYYKLLCASAFYLLKNENESKDLVQSFFLDVWEKGLYKNFHSDVKGYLFLAVRNRCFNHLKHQKVSESKRENYARLVLSERPDPDPGPANDDHYQQLHSVLGAMKGQRKKAILSIYLDEKKYKEAADSMGIGVNSLKTHLKSGLKLLRDAMKIKTD